MEEKLGNPSMRRVGFIFPTTWKVYGNPFYHISYYDHHLHHHHPLKLHRQNSLQQEESQDHLHLPHSARSLGATLWCLINPFKPKDPADAISDLHLTRAPRIKVLKAELEFERRLRKKAEAIIKELARKVSEERKGREAREQVCEVLAVEVSRRREDMERLKREVEEILRVAEAPWKRI